MNAKINFTDWLPFNRVAIRLIKVGMSFFVIAYGINPQVAQAGLRVSDNDRYLVTEEGAPFFYLGDTAWELFHRLDRKAVDRYLSDRAEKGFTVIQAVALAELDGLNTPNAYGKRPLLDNDPARPATEPGRHNDYWDHIDYAVDRAESLGLHIGLLPTWGDKFNKKWGVGPVVFTPENAEAYGRFLGERYGDEPIIWILGGDRNPETKEHEAIIRAMATGIEARAASDPLMTYHPQGGANSAQWFHNDDWLDFNSFQSSHGKRHLPNYKMTLENYNREPVKPTLDIEPRYEDHPVSWDPENGWFYAWDVRQAAYWSMLSGACGHTYGNHNIWQMWQPGRDPISAARTPWYIALEHPGARQMGYMRRLLERRPFYRLVPDQELLVGDTGTGGRVQRAARDRKGEFALAYSPYGQTLHVDLTLLANDEVNVGWFNPRQGTITDQETIDASEEHALTPPTQGRKNDWILVLELPEADLPPLEYTTEHDELLEAE